MNMMLGLELCFSAVVTDNSKDTTDRNQRSCILKRNKIYDTSTIIDIISISISVLMLMFEFSESIFNIRIKCLLIG